MDSSSNSVIKNVVTPYSLLLTFLVCAGLYLYFFAFKAQFEVNLEISANELTDFKIYWAAPGQGFSESNSSSIKINGRNRKYSTRIGHLASIGRLRIDPIEFL